MAALSDHQLEALASYYRLFESHPEMFARRKRRPIVRDPHVLENFAAEHEVILGVVARTPYLWLVNDLVQSRDAADRPLLHPYLRIISPPQSPGGSPPTTGSVVLATIDAPATTSGELIVLIEQERHATGRLELELPRGFGQPGVSPSDQALAELRQETGYRGNLAYFLGATLSDSGTSDRSAAFFHVPVADQDERAPEDAEAITRVVLLTRDEIWRRIDSGEVRDAFTVQALALYERRLRKVSLS